MLGYCWLFTLFLRRLARCFNLVQREVDSAPIYLTSIVLLIALISTLVS